MTVLLKKDRSFEYYVNFADIKGVTSSCLILTNSRDKYDLDSLMPCALLVEPLDICLIVANKRVLVYSRN